MTKEDCIAKLKYIGNSTNILESNDRKWFPAIIGREDKLSIDKKLFNEREKGFIEGWMDCHEKFEKLFDYFLAKHIKIEKEESNFVINNL